MAVAASSALETDIPARMDRLPVTRMHGLAMLICALGMMLDTLEMSFGGVLATVFSAPSAGVAPADLSLLLASVFVGAVIGAPALGWWADRHGRRTALTALLLWISAASLGAAFSQGITALTVCRFLCGVALGGYPPIVIAYLTDLLPPQRRGTWIFGSLSLSLLGPPCAIFLVRWLTPLQPLGLEGWRWGFLLGGIGAALSGLLFFALPESPRWLRTRGRAAQAEAGCAAFERSAPLASGPQPAPRETTATAEPARPKDEYRRALPEGTPVSPAAPDVPGDQASDAPVGRRWLWVAGLFALSPWATVAFPLLTGAVLTQRGFKVDAALLIFGLSSLGPLLGTLAASTVMDRIERRLAMGACTLAMLACGTAFIFGSGTTWLIIAMGLFNLAISLYVTLLTVYGAELFPTQARASATAGAWALNRVGGALGPLLLVPMLHSAGPTVMFGVVAASLMATLAVLAAAPPGRQRQSVS